MDLEADDGLHWSGVRETGFHRRLPAGGAVRLRPLIENRPFRAGSVFFTPFSVSHVVPAYGYIVAKPGRSVVFSGDTEPTLIGERA